MSLGGGCNCGNIQFIWHIPECTCTPRACQCDYCYEKGAAYVTEAGSKLDVRIEDASAHAITNHGANLADFHECAICTQVIFITVQIGGELYGAINANALECRDTLPPAEKLNFSNQSAEEKLRRWRQNWCCPVRITS